MSATTPYTDLFVEANHALDADEYPRAFALFREAAAGDTSAQASLGYCFDLGVGVNPDRDQAYYWYRKAATQGDTCGCYNLALLYRDDGNPRRAKVWLEKAVELGDADAALELARMALTQKTRTARAKALAYVQAAMSSAHLDAQGQVLAEQLLAACAG